jgi:predicted nucleotidyltransferase
MKDSNKKMKNIRNKMKDYREKLYHYIPLRILSFLAKNPHKVFCEREIVENLRVSIGAVNQTLRLLLELDTVSREKKGNVYLYSINSENSLLRYFKIFENLLSIYDFIKEVKPYASEIILYGSCAKGEDNEDSDIDVFIKTEYKTKVRKIVNKYRIREDKLKAVVLDPLEIASSKKIDKVFFDEIKKGIVLWKGKPTYEEI